MYLHLLLVAFVITLHGVIAQTKYCPTYESDSPCFCTHGLFYGGFGTRVQCASIEDTQTLIDQVKLQRGYKVDYFYLTLAKLPYLPSGLFNETSVKRIIVQKSTLGRLSGPNGGSPFDGLEDSLEEMSFQNVKVEDPSTWYWPDMKSLKKLKYVAFDESPIDFVGHVFSEIGGGSLSTIYVTYSSVNRIHPQAFQEITDIRRAYFSGNNIPYLVRTMFPNPAPKLQELGFSGNKLFTLNENMFENMPALNYLDFSWNEFKHFESKPFVPVWNQLMYFYMSTNPFRCDCSLIPLQQELLSGSYPLNQDLELITCSNPGDKKKRYLRDLDAESMHCKL